MATAGRLNSRQALVAIRSSVLPESIMGCRDQGGLRFRLELVVEASATTDFVGPQPEGLADQLFTVRKSEPLHVAAVSQIDDVELLTPSLRCEQVAAKADRLVRIVNELLFDFEFTFGVQLRLDFEANSPETDVHTTKDAEPNGLLAVDLEVAAHVVNAAGRVPGQEDFETLTVGLICLETEE
jgi:hypothetical protein